MEILELLLWVFGEICCQLLATGSIDALAGTAIYKTKKKRVRARQQGEQSPAPDFWSRALWVLLPLAVLQTLILIGCFIWRQTR